MLDEEWLAAAIAKTDAEDAVRLSGCKRAVHHCIRDWAVEFAALRDDVSSAKVTWGSRGLRPDEVDAFARAWAEALVDIDDAGYFSLPSLRRKPAGRYALLSKNGPGVSVNLEYLIQVGATAELVLDHGWAAEQVDFERGEFDALGYSEDGHVVLAMEAKARVAGPDSLASMLRAWTAALNDPAVSLENNAGRKLRELRQLARERPVLVWLVANQARGRSGLSPVRMVSGCRRDPHRHGRSSDRSRTGEHRCKRPSTTTPVCTGLPPQQRKEDAPGTDRSRVPSHRSSRSRTHRGGGSPGASGPSTSSSPAVTSAHRHGRSEEQTVPLPSEIWSST